MAFPPQVSSIARIEGRHRLRGVLFAVAGLAAVLCAADANAADPASAFDCARLSDRASPPVLEGRDGTFLRIGADIGPAMPMSAATIGKIATLSRELAARGTTLVYVPVPTRAEIMPEAVPAAAEQYGYSAAASDALYGKTIAALDAAGIATVDLMTPLRAHARETAVLRKADFLWTSAGARIAADTVAARIKALPAYAGAPKTEFATHALGTTRIDTPMRASLQALCRKPLPPVEETIYATGLQGPVAAAGIALAGSDFSTDPASHFAGFLEQATSLYLESPAPAGANPIAALIATLDAPGFAARPPAFLVWENPVGTDLSAFGPVVWENALALAGADCTPGSVYPSAREPRLLIVDPEDLGHTATGVVAIAAPGAQSARLSFTDARGRDLTLDLSGAAFSPAEGRFLVPLRALAMTPVRSLELSFDLPVAKEASVSFCSTGEGKS